MERRNFLKAMVGAVAAIPFAGKAMTESAAWVGDVEMMTPVDIGKTIGPEQAKAMAGRIFIKGSDAIKTDEWQQIDLIEDLGLRGRCISDGDQVITCQLQPYEENRKVGSMWVRVPKGQEVREQDIAEAASRFLDEKIEVAEFRALNGKREHLNGTTALSSGTLQLANLEVHSG